MRKLVRSLWVGLCDHIIVWAFWKSSKHRTQREILAFCHFLESIECPITLVNMDTGEVVTKRCFEVYNQGERFTKS
jgi:hypothetical protein